MRLWPVGSRSNRIKSFYLLKCSLLISFSFDHFISCLLVNNSKGCTDIFGYHFCCYIETLLCNTNGRLQHQRSGQCRNDILSCGSRAGSLDSITNLLRLLLLWKSLNNSSEKTEPNGPQMLVETKGFVNPIQKLFFLCSEITLNNSKFLKYKMGLSLSNNE